MLNCYNKSYVSQREEVKCLCICISLELSHSDLLMENQRETDFKMASQLKKPDWEHLYFPI